ncbi:MAG: TRAP transporter small permease [Candidatus Competibacteraceae bacterium]|nr:TRAP transporter small permease [Candidatus Competibacteraceae bacterium]MCB1810617.1 TRAP transporter small permease [Candidatus Competibacteraceae bacterium]
MTRTFSRIKKTVEYLVTLALFAMVALTFADVIGRRFFSAPVYGAHDLTEHLMALIIFCGLPVLTAIHGHLTVDLFDRFLLRPSLRWWHRFIALGMAALLALIGYQYVIAAIEAGEIREISQELSIPRNIMYAFMATMCWLSALAAALTSGSAGEPHAHIAEVE